MNMKRRITALTCAVLLALPVGSVFSESTPAKEVRDVTHTQVIVRQHPKTGKPYVSIVPEGDVIPDPFTGLRQSYIRPDYRMLDPKVKSGDIPYNGPVSDRKKVYVFAASLMTVGTVGGAVGMATAPVAAGTAAGGAGAYVGAGIVVAGTATAASLAASKKRPWDDDYQHTSESTVGWSPGLPGGLSRSTRPGFSPRASGRAKRGPLTLIRTDETKKGNG